MTEQTSIPQTAASEVGQGAAPNTAKKWFALATLCFGVLMIMLDSTIVNVALPSIKTDLQFSDSSLAWVVNGYFLFYGGFLLLGGRLGDLFGHRKLFLTGIGLFTFASLACAAAPSPLILIVARAAQGFGGAIVTAVALSLIMGLFPDPKGRATAMGVYGFVCASGSSIGALLGGFLTNSFGWQWIFLINLPIGVFVVALSLQLLSRSRKGEASAQLDVFGAITGTGALMLAVYAIVNGNSWGWASAQLLGCIASAAALFLVFLKIESKVEAPLVPLRLFRLQNVSAANIVVTLWAAALFSWFFLSSLYLQFVSGYDPMTVGLAFLPANLIMAIFSLSVSGWLVNKVGIRWPLTAGLATAAAGLFLLARMPVQVDFVYDVMPGMLLFGLGAGIAINPMLLAATNGVPESESGLVSGLVNTSFAMGGAFWLALLTSFATYYTQHLERAGLEEMAALGAGYRAAFIAAAGCALLAAVLGASTLKTTQADDNDGTPAETDA